MYLQENPKPLGNAPLIGVQFYNSALILQMHFMSGLVRHQFDPNYFVCLGDFAHNITARCEPSSDPTDILTFPTKFSLTTKISLPLTVVTTPRLEFCQGYG